MEVILSDIAMKCVLYFMIFVPAVMITSMFLYYFIFSVVKQVAFKGQRVSKIYYAIALLCSLFIISKVM